MPRDNYFWASRSLVLQSTRFKCLQKPPPRGILGSTSKVNEWCGDSRQRAAAARAFPGSRVGPHAAHTRRNRGPPNPQLWYGDGPGVARRRNCYLRSRVVLLVDPFAAGLHLVDGIIPVTPLGAAGHPRGSAGQSESIRSHANRPRAPAGRVLDEFASVPVENLPGFVDRPSIPLR